MIKKINEFCTVKFSLSEGKDRATSLLQPIKEALEWITKTYLMPMAALSFMTLFGYLSILTLEKVRTQI